MFLPPKDEIAVFHTSLSSGCRDNPYDHPVVILSPSLDNGGYVVVLIITSFDSTDLKVKHSSNQNIRRRYLPISPAEPHPDLGILLRLQNNRLMSSKSYVNTQNQRSVPLAALRPYRRRGPPGTDVDVHHGNSTTQVHTTRSYILTEESYRVLADHAGYHYHAPVPPPSASTRIHVYNHIMATEPLGEITLRSGLVTTPLRQASIDTANNSNCNHSGGVGVSVSASTGSGGYGTITPRPTVPTPPTRRPVRVSSLSVPRPMTTPSLWRNFKLWSTGSTPSRQYDRLPVVDDTGLSLWRRQQEEWQRQRQRRQGRKRGALDGPTPKDVIVALAVCAGLVAVSGGGGWALWVYRAAIGRGVLSAGIWTVTKALEVVKWSRRILWRVVVWLVKSGWGVVKGVAGGLWEVVRGMVKTSG